MLGFGQAAELGYLDVYHVHCVIGVSSQQNRKAIEVFIHYEGQGSPLPHGEAFFVSKAGLLHVNVEFLHCSRNADGFMLSPSRVGIRNQLFTGLHLVRHGVDPLHVDVGVAAYLKLKTSVALFAVIGHVGGHFFRRPL